MAALLLLTSFALLALTAPPPARQATPAAGLRCPATLAVDERATAPADWVADPSRKEHRFARISIFNGRMGEQRKDAPAELAPDGETRKNGRLTQTWALESYRGAGIVLVCRYADTDATVAREVATTVKTCEQSFDVDAKGAVVKAPKTPPSMACR